MKFVTEIIAVSYYYYDNRKTITQVIEVNTGSIIDSFTDDFSYFQSFLSINGEIVALQLSDSNLVSVHYIDSPQQSFVMEDAELLYTDSSPFSYNSKALFIIRDNQVLFHDLKSHKESLAFSLPSNNPNDPRDRGRQFSMSLNQKYCLIWDVEDEFYLISVASRVISKIDLQQSSLIKYIKYCPELNQFLLADDHVLVTIDPDNVNYRILDISNSDSTHRLITTDHTCIFMLLNDESMEADLQVGKVVHEYTHYDYSLIARSNNGLEIRSSYHHDYSLEDWVVYTITLANGMSEISLDFHKDECTVACFLMDSKSGLSASRDAIAIWDSEQGRIIEWHLLELVFTRKIWYNRRAMRYTSDMTDSQWEIIKPILQGAKYRSLKEKREQINAVFYLVKTGCQWRNLPKDFPKWKTVYSFYRRACLNGIWGKIQKALVKKVRLAKGKKETPSYALIDSQGAKTVSSNEKRGYDGGKNERKKKAHSNRYNGKSALCARSCRQHSRYQGRSIYS